MIPIQQINFHQLLARYEGSAVLDEAVRTFHRYDEAKLSRLLRHHGAPVEGLDIQRREGFDQMLEMYSLMEIAAITGFVDSLPSEYRRSALARLTNPAVRTYYERNYKLLLPSLHRMRLEKCHALREKGDDLPALMSSFLQLNALIEHDPDVETFLWFLEDGWIDGEGLPDMIDIVRDRDRFIDTMVRSPDDRSPSEDAVHGLRTFLFFSIDFDNLLAMTSDYPLTQSAFWHYHAYWYDNLSSDLGSNLRNAVTGFLAWAGEGGGDDLEQERKQIAAAMMDAIDRLVSGGYGKALRNAAGSIETPDSRPNPVSRFIEEVKSSPPFAWGFGVDTVHRPRPAGRKRAARKAAKKPARKSAGRKAATPARKKASAKKSAAKRPARKKAAKKSGAKKYAAKKPTKRTATRKASKKRPAKKPTPKSRTRK